MTVTELIQATLVPIVLISASGLIIITLQNRYGRIHDRIRTLLLEKRELPSKMTSQEALEKRQNVVSIQVELLVKRGRLIKWSMISMYIAIAIYIIVSLLIFSNAMFGATWLYGVILLTFALGLTLIMIGSILIVVEIIRSASSLSLEIEMETA